MRIALLHRATAAARLRAASGCARLVRAGAAALIAAALAHLCAPASSAAAEPNAVRPVIGTAIDGFVRPGYALFHDAASTLQSAAGALCETPSPAALSGARAAFGAAVDAWSEIEVIRFGPVAEENRLERLLFWPDRKGIGLRQVQAALAAKDPTVADRASLAGKSVAMQGFGALEFVLFGTGSDGLAEGDAHRCAYGAAIAGNIASIAAAVDADWANPDGFAERWRNPGDGNPLYRDENEALTELLGVFVEGLELIRDVRLNGFLGAAAGDDKPRQALFWRSGRTIDALAHNIAGLRKLFDASGIGELTAENMRWIGESIRFEFANAERAAREGGGPVANVLADPARRGKLDYLRLTTSSLSELFGTRLSAELGLTAGFSSLDGD